MGNPGAPSPLCSAVGQRARSERVLSTLDPSSGPAATIKCWHVMACTQGRDLFEANGAAPWHAARVVGSNALRESAARLQPAGPAHNTDRISPERGTGRGEKNEQLPSKLLLLEEKVRGC